nr:pre-mRNA-splicing factor 38-like [Procambarus clarkii]
MDEYIDCLLRDECLYDIILPRIQKRPIHEANNELKGRVSVLNDDLDNLERESDEDIFPPPRPRMIQKLRVIDRSGQIQFTHMDEYIDCLLRDECLYDIILPRIQKRPTHEANNELKGRVSVLNDDLDNLERESDEEDIFPPPRPRMIQ